jgi:hypothetical protein
LAVTPTGGDGSDMGKVCGRLKIAAALASPGGDRPIVMQCEQAITAARNSDDVGEIVG